MDGVSDVQPPTAGIEQSLLGQLGQTQRQLDELRQQLTESQRLATIGTISAVIAHEFNNLLTPMVSYSQFALQSAKSDKPDMELIIKALGKAFAGAEKAGKICAAMLALARGETSFNKVPVQTLIDQVLAVLARSAEGRHRAARPGAGGSVRAGGRRAA